MMLRKLCAANCCCCCLSSSLLALLLRKHTNATQLLPHLGRQRTCGLFKDRWRVHLDVCQNGTGERRSV